MDAEREQAIWGRVGKATPGPWTAIKLAEGDAWYCYTNYWAYLRPTGSTWWSREDAEFMAAARDDIPDLLATIDDLRAQLAAALASTPAPPRTDEISGVELDDALSRLQRRHGLADGARAAEAPGGRDA